MKKPDLDMNETPELFSPKFEPNLNWTIKLIKGFYPSLNYVQNEYKFVTYQAPIKPNFGREYFRANPTEFALLSYSSPIILISFKFILPDLPLNF